MTRAYAILALALTLAPAQADKKQQRVMPTEADVDIMLADWARMTKAGTKVGVAGGTVIARDLDAVNYIADAINSGAEAETAAGTLMGLDRVRQRGHEVIFVPQMRDDYIEATIIREVLGSCAKTNCPDTVPQMIRDSLADARAGKWGADQQALIEHDLSRYLGLAWIEIDFHGAIHSAAWKTGWVRMADVLYVEESLPPQK